MAKSLLALAAAAVLVLVGGGDAPTVGGRDKNEADSKPYYGGDYMTEVPHYGGDKNVAEEHGPSDNPYNGPDRNFAEKYGPPDSNIITTEAGAQLDKDMQYLEDELKKDKAELVRLCMGLADIVTDTFEPNKFIKAVHLSNNSLGRFEKAVEKIKVSGDDGGAMESLANDERPGALWGKLVRAAREKALAYHALQKEAYAEIIAKAAADKRAAGRANLDSHMKHVEAELKKDNEELGRLCIVFSKILPLALYPNRLIAAHDLSKESRDRFDKAVEKIKVSGDDGGAMEALAEEELPQAPWGPLVRSARKKALLYYGLRKEYDDLA